MAGQRQSAERMARRMAEGPGAGTVRRPVIDNGDQEFDLHYIRSGPRTDRPLVIIPGGPGLATFMPYAGLRKSATKRGLDVIMMEHRGIGLSRTDDSGTDLPREAMIINAVVDDLAAVLDACGVEQAVIYGTSYGSYLAQVFGIRHPTRVAGMVLDSTILAADFGVPSRDELRRLYGDDNADDGPDAEAATADSRRLLRSLIASAVVDEDEAGSILQTVHEFAGPATVRRLLELRASGRGRRMWDWVRSLGQQEITEVVRYLSEFDLAGTIAFRELGFAPTSDGRPLDPNLTFVKLAADFPPFAGEPYDLPSELPKFDWPVAVVSGERDVRTPRVAAERATRLLPDAVLVPFRNLGHSALDTHRLAALHVAHAVMEGGHRRLPALATRIESLPRRGASGLLGPILKARLSLEALLPAER